jgi:hypothetical protein
MSAAPHLSTYELDCLHLGQLSGDRSAAARAHLEACEPCRRVAQQLEQHRHHFAAEVLPRTRLALRGRARGFFTGQRWRRWLLVGLIPLAPAAAAVLLFSGSPGLTSLGWRRQEPAAPYVGEKGGASFQIVGNHAGQIFRVRPGQVVKPGDRIRFVGSSPHPYLMVASIDGHGRSKIYVPYDGMQSAHLGGQVRFELPSNASIQLDDHAGPERIFALFSTRSLRAEAVRSALLRIGARGESAIRSVESIDVGADEQLSVLMEKRAP